MLIERHLRRIGCRFQVVEIKSATPENLETQVRLGLGQVLQYAFQLEAFYDVVRPALAVELRPPDPWPAIAARHGVALAWPENFEVLFDGGG